MAKAPSRWWIAFPLIAVLALFAGWSAWWWWASGFAQSKFTEARQGASEKIAIACQSETWSGYPYRFMFTCRDPHITLKRSGTQILANRLDILAQAYSPAHIIARLTGPTRIANPARAIDVNAEHQPAVTGIKLSGGRFKIATSRIRKLIARDNAFSFAAEEIVLHTRPAAEPRTGLDFALQAQSLTATPPSSPAVSLDALVGEANLDRLPASPTGTLEALLESLARNGSTFTLDRLAATSGPLTATASGTIALTSHGLMTGTIKTTINDPAPVMAGLELRGLLSKKQVSAAGALLGLFKTKGGIAADLRLKDGKIYWGPLKLGQHPPLF